MMRVRSLLNLLAILALASSSAQAADTEPQERRVALIIANGEYDTQSDLANPVKDGTAIAAVLKKQGFSMIGGGIQQDLTKREMEKAIDEFGKNLTPDSVGFFLYAGHGLSVRERNYMMPVDIELEEAWQADTDLVDARRVMKAMASAGNRLNIVILDACRSDTFAGEGEPDAKPGMAKMDVPGGMIVSYSTQPGNAAKDYFQLPDGSLSENSPYATGLIEAMQEPGLGVMQVFNQVGLRTRERTEGKQQPWIAMSPIEGDFYFAEAKKGPAELQTALLQGAQTLGTVQPGRPEKPGTKPRPAIRDCDDCPELIDIKPASFLMGSDDGDPDEKPAHKVALTKPFAIGKYEVTFDEWDACVAAGGCANQANDGGWGRGKQPVVNVSWEDAQQYAAWLSERTGKRYRLPTEAQWEYVARAGQQTRDVAPLGVINCAGCGSEWDNMQPGPVGSFRPNAFGVHDILGNVWEWVQDCRLPGYDAAPADGSAAEAAQCDRRVLRGGSWADRVQLVRAANRGGTEQTVRSGLIGFRILREE